MKFLNRCDQFAHSYYYLSIMAMIAYVGWYFDNLSISYIGISFFLVLTPILTKDVKTLLPMIPLGMTCFRNFFFFNSIPYQMIIISIALGISIFLFIVRNIIEKNIHIRFNLLSKSLFILATVITLSAVMRQFFYPGPAYEECSNSYQIWFGYLFGILLFVLFILSLFFSCLKTAKHENYFVKVFYIFSIYILMQHVISYVSNDRVINKKFYLDIGWCDKNTMQVAVEFCLPFLAYIFGKNRKRIDAILIMLALMFFTLASDSRGGQITIGVMAPFLVYLMVKELKHKWFWYFGFILTIFGVSLIAYIYIPEVKESILRIFELKTSLSNRDVFWQWILDYIYDGNLLKSMFGGSGTYLFELYGEYMIWATGKPSDTLGIWLCHNTIFTMIALGGSVGVMALIYFCFECGVGPIWHCKDKGWLYFIVFFGQIIHGLVDNNIFNPLFIIPFIIVLSSYEKKFKQLL